MSTIVRSSCSDPLSPEAHERWATVEAWLVGRGEAVAVLPPGIGPWSDPDWWLVADPTGGSMARDSLPVLMGDLPKSPSDAFRRRAWWSMSDNSLVLNALVDRGLCRVLHGHPLTLSGRHEVEQKARFAAWSQAVRSGQDFPASELPPLRVVRGPFPDPNAVIGGNLTALERLGDTPWRPRPQGRLLLLESLSCPAAHAAHRVAALVEDPWWDEIGGLVLGRFTVADRDDRTWRNRCLSLLPPDFPVYELPLVGHGADGWTLPLGEVISFSKE